MFFSLLLLLLLFLFKLKIAHYLINCTIFDGTNASVVMSNLRKKDVADLINVCLLFLLCIYFFFNEKVLDIFKCASFSHGSLVHIYDVISQSFNLQSLQYLWCLVSQTCFTSMSSSSLCQVKWNFCHNLTSFQGNKAPVTLVFSRTTSLAGMFWLATVTLVSVVLFNDTSWSIFSLPFSVFVWKSDTQWKIKLHFLICMEKMCSS